jgi:hypothetical protein
MIWKSSGQQYPCLIFNSLKMKKLFLLGTFALLLSTTLFSCTADEYETTDNKTKVPSYADYPTDGGGQSGQTPIPPPKP